MNLATSPYSWLHSSSSCGGIRWKKEPILFAMGIRESGEYEILGFYLASKESHLSYVAVIKDLYDRGVREPLLLIADGLPKLDEEVRRVFPRADFQLCTVHASRNFKSEVREMDKQLIDRQLKKVFVSENSDDALERLRSSNRSG